MLDWIKDNKFWLLTMVVSVPLGMLGAKADIGNQYKKIALEQNEILKDIEKVITD